MESTTVCPHCHVVPTEKQLEAAKAGTYKCPNCKRPLSRHRDDRRNPIVARAPFSDYFSEGSFFRPPPDTRRSEREQLAQFGH